MLVKNYNRVYITKIISLILCIAVSIIILLGSYNKQNDGKNIVFLLDSSHSMNTTDERGKQGESSSRLNIAKEIMLNMIDQHPSQHIGLIIFTEKANYYIPPTLDHQKLKTSIPTLHTHMLASQGSNIDNALSYAQATKREDQLSILITDGGEQAQPGTGTIGSIDYIVGLGSTQGGLIRNPDGSIYQDAQGRQHNSIRNDNYLTMLAQKVDAKLVYSDGIKQLESIDRNGHSTSKNNGSRTYILTSILLLIGL